MPWKCDFIFVVYVPFWTKADHSCYPFWPLAFSPFAEASAIVFRQPFTRALVIARSHMSYHPCSWELGLQGDAKIHCPICVWIHIHIKFWTSDMNATLSIFPVSYLLSLKMINMEITWNITHFGNYVSTRHKTDYSTPGKIHVDEC